MSATIYRITNRLIRKFRLFTGFQVLRKRSMRFKKFHMNGKLHFTLLITRQRPLQQQQHIPQQQQPQLTLQQPQQRPIQLLIPQPPLRLPTQPQLTQQPQVIRVKSGKPVFS